MSKFSKNFKNKKDEDDFYIALVVIVVFLIGGFYFSSTLLSTESPVVLNNITEQSTEIQDFQFENKDDEELTIAILKDTKKQEQLDVWLEETPKMDSMDVAKVTNQITANDDKESLNDTEIVESRGTDTENKERNEAKQAEIEQNKAEEIEKARIAAEAAANKEAEWIAQEKAKAELAAKEAKAQIEAKKKAEAIAEAKRKAQAEAKKKADAKARIAAYNCAIIVGSFQTAEPADQLKATLVKQGYPAYTFFRKNLKVVGIKQSCNNEKALQQQLTKFRKTFPEAWILRK